MLIIGLVNRNSHDVCLGDDLVIGSDGFGATDNIAQIIAPWGFDLQF
jgi:hypothetical protein